MDSRRRREVREEFPQLPISWQIEVLETLESQAIEALNSEKPKYACVSDLTWQWATKQDLFRFIYWDVGEFSWGFLGYVCWQESKNHTSLNGRNTSNIKWLEWLRLDLSIFFYLPIGRSISRSLKVDNHKHIVVLGVHLWVVNFSQGELQLLNWRPVPVWFQGRWNHGYSTNPP